MKITLSTELKKRIGRNVKAARINAKLTQEHLAELVGVTSEALSRVETGTTGLGIAMLYELCSALSIAPSVLMYGDAEENDVTFFVERLKHVDKEYLPYFSEMINGQINFIAQVDAKRKKK